MKIKILLIFREDWLIEEIEEDFVLFGEESPRNDEPDEPAKVPNDNNVPEPALASDANDEDTADQVNKKKRSCKWLLMPNTQNRNHAKLKNYALRESGQKYFGVKKIRQPDGKKVKKYECMYAMYQ